MYYSRNPATRSHHKVARSSKTKDDQRKAMEDTAKPTKTKKSLRPPGTLGQQCVTFSVTVCFGCMDDTDQGDKIVYHLGRAKSCGFNSLTRRSSARANATHSFSSTWFYIASAHAVLTSSCSLRFRDTRSSTLPWRQKERQTYMLTGLGQQSAECGGGCQKALRWM